MFALGIYDGKFRPIFFCAAAAHHIMVGLVAECRVRKQHDGLTDFLYQRDREIIAFTPGCVASSTISRLSSSLNARR